MNPFGDLYCYPGTMVLTNKLGIRDQDQLNEAEADIVAMRLKELAERPLPGRYGFRHLCAIHKYLFFDLFEWAGEPRANNIFKFEEVLAYRSIKYTRHEKIVAEATQSIGKMKKKDWGGMSLDRQAATFSHCFAQIWKIHPFREGNTRTITQFCCQFADSINMPIDQTLLADNAEYLRKALVAANAVFDEDDLGDKSKPEYLQRIILDALQRGRKRLDSTG